MPDKTFPSHALDKEALRLRSGMRDSLASAAADNGRSMNAEIVKRLEESFAPRPDTSALLNRLDRLQRDLARTSDSLVKVDPEAAAARAAMEKIADEVYDRQRTEVQPAPSAPLKIKKR